MLIDKNNVDEIVFMDKKLRDELLHLKHHFDQWTLGKRVPALRFLAQRSQLAMLDDLAKTNNRLTLEKYLNEKVDIQTMDYHIAKHHAVPLAEAEGFLNNMQGFANNYSVSRDEVYLYISFWR
jgi:hypothetical protein